MPDQQGTFEGVKDRIDEIADIIARDGIDLDEALSLYEEAVKLGLSACDLSEQDILGDADSVEAEEDSADEAHAQEGATGIQELSAEEDAQQEQDGSQGAPSDGGSQLDD